MMVTGVGIRLNAEFYNVNNNSFLPLSPHCALSTQNKEMAFQDSQTYHVLSKMSHVKSRCQLCLSFTREGLQLTLRKSYICPAPTARCRRAARQLVLPGCAGATSEAQGGLVLERGALPVGWRISSDQGKV